MSRSKKERDRMKLEQRLPLFPWYIQNFIIDEHQLSPSTHLGYSYDYEIFLKWLLAEGICSVGNIKDVPISTLESLPKSVMNNFIDYLRHIGNEDATIARKMATLKKLFHYLVNVAEHDDGSPYMTRNVMAKVQFSGVKVDPQTRADLLQRKILNSKEEVDAFRDFVKNGYGKLPKLSTKQKNAYHFNCDRDTAIISLFLGSGARLSELTNLELDMLDLDQKKMFVHRKGNQLTSLSFSSKAKDDLIQYLNIRETRYQPNKKEKRVFLTKATHSNGKPITNDTIRKMLHRYAAAFGKPELTPHKLRHTFGTRLMEHTSNLKAVQEALGHADPKTTSIYALIGNKKLGRDIDDMDQ